MANHRFVINSETAREAAIAILVHLPLDELHDFIIRPMEHMMMSNQRRRYKAILNEIAEQMIDSTGHKHPASVWDMYYKQCFLTEFKHDINGVLVVKVKSLADDSPDKPMYEVMQTFLYQVQADAINNGVRFKK